jgi:hypothetical protein
MAFYVVQISPHCTPHVDYMNFFQNIQKKSKKPKFSKKPKLSKKMQFFQKKKMQIFQKKN